MAGSNALDLADAADCFFESFAELDKGRTERTEAWWTALEQSQQRIEATLTSTLSKLSNIDDQFSTLCAQIGGGTSQAVHSPRESKISGEGPIFMPSKKNCSPLTELNRGNLRRSHRQMEYTDIHKQLDAAQRAEDFSGESDNNHYGFVAATLPLHWPAVVKSRQFRPRSQTSMDLLRMQALVEVHQSSTSKGAAGMDSDLDLKIEGRCRKRVRHLIAKLRDPNSTFSIIVEIMGVFVLLYDLVTVPYLLAWEVAYAGAIQVLAFSSLLYWTLDLCSSFIRGYYVDGELILSFSSIAKRYLKSWFALDFSIVFVEWLSMLLPSGTDSGGKSDSLRKAAKLGKMLRLLSALRIIRLARILETFMQRSISENMRLFIQIGGMSFTFLWLNHMATCAWYTIGRAMPTDTGMHWIQRSWEFDSQVLLYTEAGMFYQYITAFHWAMSQTTLGSMEVTPANGWERLFNILALLTGFLFGSTLVSSLSAGMVEFQVRNRDRQQMLHMLRRYMVENRVHQKVALQVQRQVAERMQQKMPVAASQVTALEILSSSLLQELHADICRPHAVTHPMLAVWSFLDPQWFRKFSSLAITINIYRPSDEIFAAGLEAIASYYVIAGTCTYTQEPASAPVGTTIETEVGGKAWIAESALWSEWTHVGSLAAVLPCQLLTIEPDKLIESVQQHIVVRNLSQEYSATFHKRIVTAKPPHAHYPSDLRVPWTDQGDLVYSMSQEAQRQIGLTAIRHAVNTSMGHAGIAKLKEEVAAGKSVVILDSRGSAERVVSLVILSMVKDGRILYQIGEVVRGEIVPKGCVLPAVKRLRTEVVTDALKRLSEDKMGLDQDSFEVDHVEDAIEEKQSNLGVRSRYLRKIVHARLWGNFRGQSCRYLADEDERAFEPCASSRLGITAVSVLAPRTARQVFRSSPQLVADTMIPTETLQSTGSDVITASWEPDNTRPSPVYFVPNKDKPGDGDLYCWLLPHTVDDLVAADGLSPLLKKLILPPSQSALPEEDLEASQSPGLTTDSENEYRSV